MSVKATRGEGMGFVGREEGAAALAVATIERRRGRVRVTSGRAPPVGAGTSGAGESLGGACGPASGRTLAHLLVLDQPLELLQRAAQVPAHGGRGDALGQPA